MRFATLFLALTLALGATVTPAHAAKKAKERKPAATGKAVYRVISLDCRDESNQPTALGLAQLSVDIKNNDTGFFGLTLYVRTGKGTLSPKSLSGAYTTVPDGYILQASWPGAPGDQIFLHLHPRDKTSLPGVNAKLSCAAEAQLEQL